MDTNLKIQKTIQDDDLTSIMLNNGMFVSITMVELRDDKPDQLCVVINTEGMDADDCHKDGTPLMNIMLNDATLYDCEPESKVA